MHLSIFKNKTAFATKQKTNKRGSNVLKFLQELGKSLQFPIAVLPFAAILNRFGALGIQFTSETVDGALQINNAAGYWISYIIQSGGAVAFDNLALFFAIGIGFGLAKDHRGEAALAGGLFYLAISAMTSKVGSFPSMIYDNVLTHEVFDPKTEKSLGWFSQLLYVNDVYVLNIGALGGIVAGSLSAVLYNKFKDIKLPQALSFFGGRRFVPMLVLLSAVPTGLLFAIIWPWINFALIKFGNFTTANSATFGSPLTGVYAMFNRLLLPFGLHQILNTLFWFQLPFSGDVIGSWNGEVINHISSPILGDINAFAAGIDGAGIFQSGFFPIMMGGIPAIALAMIMTAEKSRRKEVAGFLGGVALVSFVSGITEPIEFSFVFLSPLLLGVHAILSGIMMAIVTAMGIQVGFGFSAGLIDYMVSFPQSWGFFNHSGNIASNPLWILPLIVACGTIYYFVFYFLIKKLDIQTIGREKDYVANENETEVVNETTNDKKVIAGDKYQVKAQKIVDAIGIDNFVSIDNCATRLRLILKDTSKIDDPAIKKAGAFGIIKLTKEAVQIVIGADVEHVANAMKEIVK